MSSVKQGKIMTIYSAQEMCDFCVKHMSGPSCIVKSNKHQWGRWVVTRRSCGASSTTGQLSPKFRMSKTSQSPRGLTADLSGTVFIEARMSILSVLIEQFIHSNSLATTNVRSGAAGLSFALLGGYCMACLEAGKIGMGEWRGETGIACREGMDCTCSDWARLRRWSVHLKKTRMRDVDREKRKGVIAKRNKLAKKQKDAAKKLKLNQAQ